MELAPQSLAPSGRVAAAYAEGLLSKRPCGVRFFDHGPQMFD
jgi:hypothetical protein